MTLGCVYNHLNWTLGLGASAVLGCGANQTVCDVRVAPGAGWVAVYVRQNNDTAILYAIYNTGKKDGATRSTATLERQGREWLHRRGGRRLRGRIEPRTARVRRQRRPGLLLDGGTRR